MLGICDEIKPNGPGDQTSPARAIGLAMLVAGAGFGALCVFWFVGDWRDDVPGLFDYRSATFGDALLLPTIVAILFQTARSKSLVHTKKDRRWTLGATAVGLLAGAATQVLWLADDSPAPNWSFPHAHHFNVAGWYHAVFLTTGSGLLCALGLLAARRVRGTRRLDPERTRHLARSPWLGMLFGCGVALAGLIALDNGRAKDTAGGGTTTVAVTISSAVGLLLLAWALGTDLRRSAPALIAGAAAAALLSVALR